MYQVIAIDTDLNDVPMRKYDVRANAQAYADWVAKTFDVVDVEVVEVYEDAECALIESILLGGITGAVIA